MAFKGPCHLHVESYLWIRLGLCSVCLRLGGQYGGHRSSVSLPRIRWSQWDFNQATEQATTYSHTHSHTHILHNIHTYTGSLHEPTLPCNLQHQHGPSPFQIENMVQTQKTKQTGWPPQCIVHGVRLVFSSPLTRSIYTDSKSILQLWLRLHTYIPVIIQWCILRRFYF